MISLAGAKVRCWHGWERAPLECAEGSRGAAGFAYFGILPRGLMSRAARGPEPGSPALDATDWSWVAPRLEAARHTDSASVTPELAPWLDAARALNVLSIEQSAAACAELALALAEPHTGTPEALDLWLVKEGHTASVWRVEVERRGERVTLAINVGRDDEASRELASSYEQLSAWHARDPEHVAAPLGIRRGSASSEGSQTVVTAHAWVHGRELHARPSARSGAATLEAELIEIEGFLPHADSGRLQALGRVLGRSEQQRVWSHLLAFYRRHARVDAGGIVSAPGVRVNDGDFVYTGTDLVAVAACAAPWSAGSDEWRCFSQTPHVEWRPGGPRLFMPAFLIPS